MVGKFHGIDCPDLPAKALKGKHRSAVTGMTVGDMGLDR
jgi:hypothetical protein